MATYLLKNVKLTQESKVINSAFEYYICIYLYLMHTGVVTEIYHGWAGGYPYLSAPLYGAMSGLPAATSWARVLTDDTDPMCVH